MIRELALSNIEAKHVVLINQSQVLGKRGMGPGILLKKGERRFLPTEKDADRSCGNHRQHHGDQQPPAEEVDERERHPDRRRGQHHARAPHLQERDQPAHALQCWNQCRDGPEAERGPGHQQPLSGHRSKFRHEWKSQRWPWVPSCGKSGPSQSGNR